MTEKTTTPEREGTPSAEREGTPSAALKAVQAEAKKQLDALTPEPGMTDASYTRATLAGVINLIEAELTAMSHRNAR